MKLQELLLKLLEDGMTEVWFYRTYGPEDYEGKRDPLDLLLAPTGEEIARRFNWLEHGAPVWDKPCGQSMTFKELPAGAAELKVSFALTLLSVGIDAETVLDAGVRPATVSRRPH